MYNSKNSPDYPSTGECKNRLWYIHAMKFFPTAKQNKQVITPSNMDESQERYTA